MIGSVHLGGVRDRGQYRAGRAQRRSPAGLRMGVGRALVGMVVAEFFTSITGLGYLIMRSNNSFQPDHLLVPVVAVMTLGIVLTAITRGLERRIAPWNKAATEDR
jgi:NitT/TauT family transport system permease protein